MDDADLRLGNHVYRRFVELGRAPRFDELADEHERMGLVEPPTAASSSAGESPAR